MCIRDIFRANLYFPTLSVRIDFTVLQALCKGERDRSCTVCPAREPPRPFSTPLRVKGFDARVDVGADNVSELPPAKAYQLRLRFPPNSCSPVYTGTTSRTR